VRLSSPSEDQPRRVAPRWLGRSPHAVVLAELGFGVFRDKVPFRSGEAREGPLLGFDSPSEYCRGAPPDAALAVFPPARAGGSGPPLLGFLVPTALCSRVPVSAAPGVTGCRRRGLPIPRPCRPRAFSAPRRVQPHRLEKTRVSPDPPSTALAPELCGLVSCRNAHGIRPTELSPPGEPYRLAAAFVLPCGFDVDHVRRDGSGVSRSLSTERRRPSRAADP
jgi:hypothetical protein